MMDETDSCNLFHFMFVRLKTHFLHDVNKNVSNKRWVNEKRDVRNNLLPKMHIANYVPYCFVSFHPCKVKRSHRQLGGKKGLTGYCFKYIDRPFCLRADAVIF